MGEKSWLVEIKDEKWWKGSDWWKWRIDELLLYYWRIHDISEHAPSSLFTWWRSVLRNIVNSSIRQISVGSTGVVFTRFYRFYRFHRSIIVFLLPTLATPFFMDKSENSRLAKVTHPDVSWAFGAMPYLMRIWQMYACPPNAALKTRKIRRIDDGVCKRVSCH